MDITATTPTTDIRSTCHIMDIMTTTDMEDLFMIMHIIVVIVQEKEPSGITGQEVLISHQEVRQ